MYENAEVVHLLDLCTLSYQLHSQTLIWPFDPYYDQLVRSKSDQVLTNSRRDEFMAIVHELANNQAYKRLHPRGPNVLGGPNWGPSNSRLDPVISAYGLINPWRPSVARPNAELEGWILYDTPPAITQRIGTVSVVRYHPNHGPPFPPDTNNPNNKFAVETITLAPNPGPPHPPGKDLLYCFEGGTGSVTRAQSPTTPAWSIMGFVLAREDAKVPSGANPPPYDVYIVFRGSRSGDPRMLRALSTAKGNSDWVTDMDFGLGRNTVQSDPSISERGKVSPGFATSVRTMLPTIMECLKTISAKNRHPPRTIYVTGHSLGAGLAAHFTSAMILGTKYRYDAPHTDMPDSVKQWPWRSMQLVPFALPVLGDEQFHDAFNITLASRNFELAGDPVPQRQRRYAVGQTYSIDPDLLKVKILGGRHEPYNIREWLIKDLQVRGFIDANPPNDSPLFRPPWRALKTFEKVVRVLARAPGDPVSNVLGPDFNERLLLYLDVVYRVAPSGSRRQRVSNLRDFVKSVDKSPDPVLLWKQVPTLEQIYDNNKNIFDTKFEHFVGLCMLLSVASKGSVGGAQTHAFTMAPFNNLPLR
jgi:hypothetical protein